MFLKSTELHKASVMWDVSIKDGQISFGELVEPGSKKECGDTIFPWTLLWNDESGMKCTTEKETPQKKNLVVVESYTTKKQNVPKNNNNISAVTQEKKRRETVDIQTLARQ